MRKPTKSFLLHSLHLLTIGLLGFFVVKTIWQNDETVLYETLRLSLERANTQALHAGKFATDEICNVVAAFNFIEKNIEAYRQAVQINRYAEKARSQFQSNRDNLSEKQKILALYGDTLAGAVFTEPEYIAYFEKLLRRPLQGNNIAVLENARIAQRDILHEFLYFNMALSNNLALDYLLRSVFGGHNEIFDAYQPVWVPEFKHPVAGQICTSTILFGAFSNSVFDKVWVNGLSIPIKNEAARFSTTFEKAGPQAISIRAEKCCFGCERQLRIYEKTYTVHVRP